MRASIARIRRNAVAVAVLGLVGCGGPAVVGVSGTVTHRGQPLAGATVVLTPDPPQPGVSAATATTAADGSFTVRTNKPGGVTLDGVPPGTYRVTVSKFVPPDGMSEAEYEQKVAAAASGVYSATSTVPPRVELLPKEFSDSAATTVRATAAAGAANTVTIAVP